MPMGIVSDSDFLSEMNSFTKNSIIHNPNTIPLNPSDTIESNSIPPTIVDIPKERGRKPGDNNVPEGLRSLIGVTSVMEGREAALELGRDFGISPSSVSAYSNGSTSTKSYNNPEKGLKDKITSAKRAISIKARKRLNQALENITEEKLEAAKLKDVAAVARDMAVIMKHMDPDDDAPGGNIINNGPTFMIYAPPVKSESDYPVIHSRE